MLNNYGGIFVQQYNRKSYLYHLYRFDTLTLEAFLRVYIFTELKVQ